MQPPIRNLTIGMIRAEGKAPRLKTQAAEGRHLVPVVAYMLEHLLPLDSPHEHTSCCPLPLEVQLCSVLGPGVQRAVHGGS
eukprot:9478004-Pyramimonas_sp.AAC.1